MRPGEPAPIPDDLMLVLRVQSLERLVLELTKHIDARQTLPLGAITEIELLKLRHPDV